MMTYTIKMSPDNDDDGGFDNDDDVDAIADINDDYDVDYGLVDDLICFLMTAIFY